MIRAVHYPDWRHANPYQVLLQKALEQEGISVSFSTYHGFFLQMFHNSRNADWLHLHWVHDLMATDRAWSPVFILRYLLFYLDLCLTRLSGVRLIWTVHNVYSHNCRHHRLEQFAKQVMVRCCRQVIVHGESVREIVQKEFRIPSHKLQVIPHGNYVPVLEHLRSKGESRSALDLPDMDRLWLYFGSIKPYKGVPELLRSWAAVRSSSDRLLLVGRIDDPEVERMISENKDPSIVVVDRFVPDAELYQWLAAADVVVLPFRRILTSGSLILALSAEKPIIAPDLGTIRDYLGTDYPLLYNPRNPEGLTAAMSAFPPLQNDPALQNLIRRRIALLGWEHIGRRIAGLYR